MFPELYISIFYLYFDNFFARKTVRQGTLRDSLLLLVFSTNHYNVHLLFFTSTQETHKTFLLWDWSCCKNNFRLIWTAKEKFKAAWLGDDTERLGIVTKDHIKGLKKFYEEEQGQYLHVNTGTHGDENGNHFFDFTFFYIPSPSLHNFLFHQRGSP